MHRVDRPDHIFTGIAHSLEQRRVEFADLGCTHAYDQVESPLFILGVECIDQRKEFIRLHGWSYLTPDRVLYPSKVLNVRFVEIACSVTYPEHMG